MNNTRPIILIIMAMAMFTIADSFIKVLSSSLPMGQILMFLGTGGGLTCALVCWKQSIPIFSRNFLAPTVIVRNLSEMIGSVSFTLALALTPISSASAILQAAPLLVTLGAALYFKEPVGWRRWSAIVVGLFGVMLIVQPGLEGFNPLSIFAVIGVIGLSARDLSTRSAPKSIPTQQLALYGFLSIIPAGAFLLMITGVAVQPDLIQFSQLFGMVIFAALGYFSITSAMRLGDLSVVSPFRYTRLLFAITVGWVIFGERPDTLTYVGAVIIVASGLYTLARERKISSSLS
jgi:drug/metabolite transporter (DMT)-like permease